MASHTLLRIAAIVLVSVAVVFALVEAVLELIFRNAQ